MRLQRSIDPEPYNPVDSRMFCESVSKPAVTPRPEATTLASLLRRVPSLGSMHRVGWLSGQPSPLSDLQTPINPFKRVFLGMAASDASSERSEQLRTPQRLMPMRS